ncbi:MAG TPA: hypothetical protein VII50_07500 [Acidothermaceae bacterium]
MYKIVTTVVGAAALGLTPVGAAAAQTMKRQAKAVVTTTLVRGPQEAAGPWGNLQVTLIVKKATTTSGKRKTIVRTITNLSVPIYPNHTARSVYINSVALPLLKQEVLKAHFNLSKVYLISGASYTSIAYGQSLQAALISAGKV